MIYENEYENCIHFDGKECRNELSCNYGSYGEFCVDCKDIEGVDNIDEIAEDFINYFELKYGLEDITKDRICSNILRDCEFHSFEVFGLSEEVIKKLKNRGIEINK